MDESEGPTYYVRSALGINVELWNQAFLNIKDWPKDIVRVYNIPLFKELHASDILAARGLIVRDGRDYKRIRQKNGVKIFISGLQRLENLAIALSGGMEIINVCLKKRQHKHPDIASLDRVLNRINTSVKKDNRYAFLIFDEGKEKAINYWYRKCRVYNPIPSKYGQWETGEEWKNIPIQNIVGGPSFRVSASDYFLQMVDFVAHALLKQEEQPPIPRITQYDLQNAFRILNETLNEDAAREDEQGIVRH
ncbi:MAG: DUF3800 domain-containing protein [Dehalococcoidia bacterium]